MALRATRCVLSVKVVADDMIRVWRSYGHRVGEVHAQLDNVHWSVNDQMLRDYLERFAMVREVKVAKYKETRRNVLDQERKWGKSLCHAYVVFNNNQEAALARLFKTRHVLNGKELLITTSDKQPEFNFYIPHTHESDSEGMDPSVVYKMSNQIVNLNLAVSGKFFHPKLAAVQRVKDQAKRSNPDPQPASHEQPWYYGMGEEKWSDEGEQADAEPVTRPQPATSSVSRFIDVASEEPLKSDRVTTEDTRVSKHRTLY